MENDRLDQYIIHSAEDYFGPIARYQLLDEAPTVSLYSCYDLQSYPFTCQFTSTVPTVLQGISNAITKLKRVCESLGVTENYAHLFNVLLFLLIEFQLVSSILDNVKEALEDQQANLESKDVREKCIVSLNWGAFAKSIDALQRILLYSLFLILHSQS